MRNKSCSVTLRNEYLLERIKYIKAEHPFWGYRRVRAYLRYVDGLIVNKKRVYWLMRENNLIVKPNTRLIAKRVSDKPNPEPVEGTTVKGSKSNSDNLQVQPTPKPVEGTSVKSSKSNASERQIEPIPKPVEGKTVTGSKSNTSE